MKVNTSGFRTDLDDYIAYKIKGQSHTAKVSTPFIVITKGTVRTHFYIQELLKEHPSSHVFHAWVGQWKTDVFYYRLRLLRDYINSLSSND